MSSRLPDPVVEMGVPRRYHGTGYSDHQPYSPMRSRPARAMRLALIPVVAAALLTACGSDSITGVSVNATVRVVIDDNPSRSMPPVGGVQHAPAPGPFGGNLAGTARIAISADGQSWHDVMGTTAITVPLQTGDSVSVENTVYVPAATYSTVRITLRAASLAGLMGETPGGSATNRTLDVEGTEVVIFRTIPAITISEQTGARISIDLNAESWIDTANFASGTIPQAKVETAVQAVAGYEDL